MFWKLVIICLITISVLTLCSIGGRNLIVLLLAIELIFFALSLACLTYFYSNAGTVWNLDLLFASIAITVLAAAESAVGLALIAQFHKRTRNIIIKKL